MDGEGVLQSDCWNERDWKIPSCKLIKLGAPVFCLGKRAAKTIASGVALHS